MTDDTMAPRGLLEQASDAELLREMIGFAAERLIALKVGGLTGAAHADRSESRINLNRPGARSKHRSATYDLT